MSKRTLAHVEAQIIAALNTVSLKASSHRWHGVITFILFMSSFYANFKVTKAYMECNIPKGASTHKMDDKSL